MSDLPVALRLLGIRCEQLLPSRPGQRFTARPTRQRSSGRTSIAAACRGITPPPAVGALRALAEVALALEPVPRVQRDQAPLARLPRPGVAEHDVLPRQ